MSVFLLDIFSNRGPQPFFFYRQTAATGHQQGHGVFDVVIGLHQIGNIGCQRNIAAGTSGQLFNLQKLFPCRLCLCLQLLKKVTHWTPGLRLLICSA